MVLLVTDHTIRHTATSDWVCSICNYTNFKRNKSCRQCERNKNKEDWKCTQCRYKNFRRNNKCRQCGTSKVVSNEKAIVIVESSGVKVRANDWFCPKCKSHQFASREVCRDCKTEKPKDTDFQKCIICTIKQRNSSLNHGSTAHVVTCYECGEKLKSCPVCRQSIDKIIKIYD